MLTDAHEPETRADVNAHVLVTLLVPIVLAHKVHVVATNHARTLHLRLDDRACNRVVIP